MIIEADGVTVLIYIASFLYHPQEFWNENAYHMTAVIKMNDVLYMTQADKNI